jgi:hypothetical protein
MTGEKESEKDMDERLRLIEIEDEKIREAFLQKNRENRMARSSKRSNNKQSPTKMKESDDDRSDDSEENEFENDMDKQHSVTKKAAGTPSPSKPNKTSPTKIRTSQVTTRSSKTINQPITHNQELQQECAEHTARSCI